MQGELRPVYGQLGNAYPEGGRPTLHNLVILYILPCDRLYIGGVEKAAKSFGDVLAGYKMVEDKRLDRIEEHGAPWFGYLQEDEWLDEDLKFALPIALEAKEDCIVFFKKVLHRGQPKYFYTPRLFREYIRLDEKLLPPPNIDVIRLLDGWLMEAPS